MKNFSAHCFFLGFLLLISRPANAQGPNIDPGFHAGQLFQPASMRQAIRQPDGKTLLLGSFQRAAGQPVGQLVRFLANGSQLDAGFQANVAGLQGAADQMLLLPGGQLLLIDDAYVGRNPYAGTLAAGGVSRQGILKLQADGSPDASFDAGLGPSAYIRQVLLQPDGKLILLGRFSAALGQPGPVLMRLNANGSPDTTFRAAAFTGGSSSHPYFAALQADGKLLVTGRFETVDGQPRQGVARLLATGGLDSTFTSPLPSLVAGARLAVQPDGKILLTNTAPPLLVPALQRLLPDGTVDASFQRNSFSASDSEYNRIAPVVQPDGKTLIVSASTFYAGTATGPLVRLLPNGALDPGFDYHQATGGRPNHGNGYPSSFQLLANGQILLTTNVRGSLFHYSPLATSLPVGVAALNADGTHDATFRPIVQDFGEVQALAFQPDGKILVGGSFSEINGVAVRNVARLQPDGLVDTTFAAATDDLVTCLALQPDGKVVLGGYFDYLDGAARTMVGRVLATGARDTAFAPPIGVSATAIFGVKRLALRPGGQVLVAGEFAVTRNGLAVSKALSQLDGATGAEDPGFSYTLAYPGQINDIQLQPGGKLLVAGGLVDQSYNSTPLWRLSLTGTIDSSFTTRNSPLGDQGYTVAQDAAGRLYLTGSFYNLGVQGNFGMARLFADGRPDPGFRVVLPGINPTATALAIQPNGRVLVGVLPVDTYPVRPTGTLRLLPDGANDPSYLPTNGPVSTTGYSGVVHRILIQPDGGILAAGAFAQAGTQSINGLVRLLDAHVLAVRPHPAAPTTAAWPVPAHGVLHLALEAAAHPQRVELLDALGRPVLAQAVAQQSELSLNTATLPPGVYLLRVHYAQGGAVTRRVVLE